MKYEKVINKENIKKQTITFVFIIAFIMGFKSIFGDKNTLIGVTTITAMLMFTNVDLTMSPLKNLMQLIALNIITGVGAYIALLNPWIGIPINFAIIFIINYRLYFNLKEPLYVPFTLQYAFILATPVTLKEMPIRLASLLVAPIAIMIFQMLFNRQKIFKKGNRIIENICSKIIEKIDIILDEDIAPKDNSNIDKDIRKYIDEFRAIVYDNRKENFYITEEARIKVNILSALEKISINLNKINNVEELKGIIIGLRQCMKRLNVVLGEDNNIKELEDYIDSVIDNHKDIQASRIHAIQILNPTQLQSINKKRFIMNSVKLSFAIRSAIGISLAAFVSDYFNLSEGRWIIFTMVSLVVPIYEASIKKAKDRFIATIIGAVIIVIVFSIFKSVAIRSIILIVAGYVNSYLSEYKHKTICTTVSAIGAAALLGNTTVLTLRRIIFVAIGVVLAIIINRFILPRKIEDYTRELEGMYLEAVKAMLKKVYLSPTENNMHGMNNLFIITSLIESRLENNKEFLNKRAIKSISQNRLLILNIHELYILFSNDKFKNIDSTYIVEDMKMLTSFTDQNIKELLDKIEDHIKKSDNIYNKMMLENIREVYKEIYKINKYVS